MFCNKCGAEIEDTAVFCSQCGNSILGGEQAAQKEISSGARAAQRKTIDAICVLLAAVVVTGIILALVIRFSGGSSQPDICGTWTALDGSMTITFQEDGSMTITFQEDGSMTIFWNDYIAEEIYHFVDNKNHTITVEWDSDEKQIMGYEFSGDIMLLTWWDDSVMFFRRAEGISAVTGTEEVYDVLQ